MIDFWKGERDFTHVSHDWIWMSICSLSCLFLIPSSSLMIIFNHDIIRISSWRDDDSCKRINDVEKKRINIDGCRDWNVCRRDEKRRRRGSFEKRRWTSFSESIDIWNGDDHLLLLSVIIYMSCLYHEAAVRTKETKGWKVVFLNYNLSLWIMK